MTGLYLLAAALLILLNAFFVLAEFAAVKLRPTRIEELIERGTAGATFIQHVQQNIDEYLSVCQIGITLTSIGLGFVGEAALADLIMAMLPSSFNDGKFWAHTIAISAAYVMVSFLHIVIGEQVPKTLAIRYPERAALWSLPPLRTVRWIFYPAMAILNASTQFFLRILRLPMNPRSEAHSESEVRMILARSQARGLLSFRRLLFLENVFDLDDISARDAMKQRSDVKVLRAGAPWSENIQIILQSRYSRFPLIDGNNPKPLGIVHVKDLILKGFPDIEEVDLRQIVRPYLTVNEATPVENVLAELQRKHIHVALVVNRTNQWTGFMTLEDIAEHIFGAIQDEFEVESPIFLADTLNVDRIVLGLQAETFTEAIRKIINTVKPGELPAPADIVINALLERERAMVTYLGHGLAIPHCRLPRLEKPVMIFARSEAGVTTGVGEEKAHLFFVLMTPLHLPQIQIKLLARIAGMMESEFVDEKLRRAATPREVLESISSAEAAVID